MARKKKQTYGDMVRSMEDMRKRVISEKDRMAGVLASVLDYGTALRLGDLSDAELRRVAALMFAHIGVFTDLVKLDAAKAQQLREAEGSSAAEGELRYNSTGSCWEVWDTDTDQLVGKLRDGMSVELRDLSGKEWESVKVGVTVGANWYMEKNGCGLNPYDRLLGIFDGLRVRIHGAKA